MQLVQKPVDVQKGRGEFVEDECWTVEVNKGALFGEKFDVSDAVVIF